MRKRLVGSAARALARAPVSLYGAGYGFLFGERLLLLEHTGRTSGHQRYVVLDVVRRLPGDRYVVASGRGTTADWYRNVIREPRVSVSVGRTRRAPARATPLGRDEARAVVEAPIEPTGREPGASSSRSSRASSGDPARATTNCSPPCRWSRWTSSRDRRPNRPDTGRTRTGPDSALSG